MPEQHNIEYKQSWHMDDLKTICAFANSQGGKLYLGKDDNGNTVGISDHVSLMEDLPNKIRNHLGITADVNLLEENTKYVIEIIVPAYSVAISLRGKYYIRTGSTTTELTGNSLNEFLLKKSGITWDDSIEERALLNDIDENSISDFLKAASKSDRLPPSDGLNTNELLEKLRLANGTKIKRAAIILFGKDPGKFYPNISVKLGRFGKDDADLKFQEIEEGNLFHLLKEIPLQLNRKFLTKNIDFEGLQRIEKGEYPVAALREMLLNALVHKNYFGSTIQIRIYDDKISIWNEGTLPEGLSFEALKRQHPSRPRNPIIADVCFKGGYIDAWGRGTLKIINSCKEAELPEPEIKESDGGFLVTIFKDVLTEEQLKKLGLNERQIKAVFFLKENKSITNKAYQSLNNTSERTALRDLENLAEMNLVEKIGDKKGTYYTLKNGG
jgi:ATP-dependent DNA helicase RecG